MVRPHIEYGDILCDKPNNIFFKSNLERVQYKFYPAITVATHDKCTEGIEDGFGNLLFLYKIIIIFIKTLSDYQISLKFFWTKIEKFNSFFPFDVTEWNKLNS